MKINGKRIASSVVSTVIVTAALVFAGNGGAQAATTQNPEAGVETITVSTSKLSSGESETVELPGGVTVVTTLGEEEVVTAADISADSSLTTAQKSELTALAAAATIKSNHYSQFTTGAAYTVTQNGTFYYDGTRVWVGTTTSGYKGSHSCFINYAAGVSISNIVCSESGTTARRDMYMGWNVNVAVVTYYYDMTAKLYANGTISGFGGTVG